MKSFLPSLGAKLLILTLLSLANGAQAQTRRATTATQSQRFNTWAMVFSDARLTNKWSLHTEGQLRQVQGLNAPQQKFLRIGANYHVANMLVLTAGYAYSMSYPDGNDSEVGGLPEHRSYQQLLLRFDSSRVLTQHRYRLEQRWLRRPGDGQFTYLNRLRYQLRLTLPLGPQRKLAPGTPYLTGSNELFFGFGRNSGRRSIFDQNRACLALGYQVNRATSVEAGYMNQMAQQESSTLAATHILHLGLNFNPDFRKGRLASPE